jgi:hypothetical protein
MEDTMLCAKYTIKMEQMGHGGRPPHTLNHGTRQRQKVILICHQFTLQL